MSNTKLFNVNDVCNELGISIWTLSSWYRYEKKLIKAGIVKVNYLPKPTVVSDAKGKPRIWTQNQVEELKNYKKNIVRGRNGVYGEFSNPNHFETKKYKKTINEQ